MPLFGSLFGILGSRVRHSLPSATTAYQPITESEDSMSLEIRKTSQWWYGRWQDERKRHCVRLKVKVEGTPPRKSGGRGDKKYEASREAAQTELDKVMARFNEQKRPEDLVQELHKVKFGQRIGHIELKNLNAAWLNIPRKREPGPAYKHWAQSVFTRFQNFLAEHHPNVREMAGISKQIAEAFMRAEDKRGVSPKTFNAELILMRGAFEHLREDAGMLSNPFGKIVTRDRDTVHRQPFSPEELKLILDAAKDDDLIRPLTIVGITTAMRRGDACLLKWEAIDMKSRFVTVKTSKTGAKVSIPMFPLLHDELATLKRGKSPFVFPELAALYQTNPDAVNKRLRAVFKTAGFVDLEDLDEDEKKTHRADVHVQREKGLIKANIRGFHSFRVTWITLALTAGVPMELVRRVTGHRTVDVVLQNYFQPGREAFRQAIQTAMPKMLSNGSRTPKEELISILSRISNRTWKKDSARALEVAKDLPD